MQLEIVFRVAPNTFDSKDGRDGLFAELTMMGVVPGSGGADEKKEAFKRGQTHHRLMIQSSFKIELEKRILKDPPLPLLQCLMSTMSFAKNHP